MPNQLIHETSPYLLQHAHNPVDWHAWNIDTLSLARTQNKLMLVSIGYSSCHWCHVMEHESFEDEHVAAIMNKHFVCIKVDREERPDVDHLFMNAVQLLGGRGGWPLNCVALPDGRPVWGGTYFRKEHWMSILQQIADFWNERPDELFEQASEVVRALKAQQQTDDTSAQQTSELLAAMTENLQAEFDPQWGGSKGAPKFPLPDKLLFLQLLQTHKHNPLIEKHIALTLQCMHAGGIWDHVGGGFARYAVDKRWHVPHFEKMLYDNAQLIQVYTRAFKATGIQKYQYVVDQTLAFLNREMKGDGPLYFSAIDADSEGKEGKFYVWAAEEFDALAPKTSAFWLKEWFGIGKEALWEHHQNVLVQPFTKDEFCNRHQLSIEDFEQTLAAFRTALFNHRSKRIRPMVDDKCLFSWNSLMLRALSEAAMVFGRDEWLEQAIQMATFMRDQMRQPDGSFFRSRKGNQSSIHAFLEDDALFAQALISLYQATFDESWILLAKEVVDSAIMRYHQPNSILLSFVPEANNVLAINPVDCFDNVMPSANAAICKAMVEVGIYFEDLALLQRAEAMISTQKERMATYPGSFTHWGQALLLLEKQQLVVVTGSDAKSAAHSLAHHLPPAVLIAAGETQSTIPAVLIKLPTEKTTYWYCDHMGCRAGITDPDQLLQLLAPSAEKM